MLITDKYNFMYLKRVFTPYQVQAVLPDVSDPRTQPPGPHPHHHSRRVRQHRAKDSVCAKTGA